MLIDTHCHFDVEDFDDDRAEVMARTLAAGVDTVVIPGYVARHWPRLLTLCAASQSPRLLPALGLHPCYIAEHEAQHLQALEGLLQSRPDIIAVGEIGLDYFLPELKSAELKSRQLDVFRAQLELASRFSKPVLLHVRKAHADVIRMLHETKFREGGIVHAFSGGVEEARHYIRMGLHLGIGGPLTYEQSRRLRAVVGAVPLEALVLETDAPDMTPQPHREAGTRTRNSPEFLPSVAEALAGLKQIPLQEVEEVTRGQSIVALKLQGWA
jgi:TatD DNase family protein